MTTPADLVHPTRRWRAADAPVRIGSAPGSSLTVAGPGVAPTHAVAVPGPDGRWVLRDLNTPGGLWHRGKRVGQVVIDGAVTVHLGGADGPPVPLQPAALAGPTSSGPSPAARPTVGPAPTARPSAPARPAAPGPSAARPAAGPPSTARPASTGGARFGRIGAPAAGPATPAAPPTSTTPAIPVVTTRPPGPAAPPAPAGRGRPATARPTTGPAATPAPGRGPTLGPAPTPGPTPSARPLTGRPAPHHAGRSRPPAGGPMISVGRAANNDIVVNDLLVAPHHAQLRATPTGWDLVDLGSPTGIMVDGVRAGSGPVRPGQRITFGTKSYVVGPDGLSELAAAPTGPGGIPALSARNIVVEVDNGTRILDDISIEVDQGQLVAIVGPSGSGKSTFLKALTGSRRPEGGAVQVRGVDLYQAYDELCRTIGYVPQDDILHLPLTIRQALTFGAELRFPADTTEADRRQRVDEVLAELDLTHRADVPVEKVSGGQRKRTSVALELLTRPELLFLDEPTSGLDPGFERTVMELLRDLASAGRAVVVVTHSLQSLELCDKVLFLAPGGHIAFFGRPDDALAWFGRDDFIDVFRDLETLPGHHWAAKRGEVRGAAPLAPAPSAPARPKALPPSQPWIRQVEILARRQVAILQADRQNLMFLVGGVVVPALLILLLMDSDTLKTGQDVPVVARNILSAVVVAAVAIGAANSIREIVKELPIYLRERAVGLQRSAYLTSKILVVGVLTAVQAAVLVVIATLRSGGPGHANLLVIPHLELIFDVALTGLAAVGLGLLLSTLVSSSEKAMALVPVVFVVMWLFSGAALDLQGKPVMRDVAKLTAANWGMAASASSTDEHSLSKSCSEADLDRFGSTSSDAATNDGYADSYGSSGYDEPYGSSDYGSPSSTAPTASADRAAEESRLEALGTCDARWESNVGSWFVSVLALLVLTVAPIALADRRLAKKEPLEAQRAHDWPFPWIKAPVAAPPPPVGTYPGATWPGGPPTAGPHPGGPYPGGPHPGGPYPGGPYPGGPYPGGPAR